MIVVALALVEGLEIGEGEGPLALREGEAEEGRDQPGPVVVEGWGRDVSFVVMRREWGAVGWGEGFAG